MYIVVSACGGSRSFATILKLLSALPKVWRWWANHLDPRAASAWIKDSCFLIMHIAHVAICFTFFFFFFNAFFAFYFNLQVITNRCAPLSTLDGIKLGTNLPLYEWSKDQVLPPISTVRSGHDPSIIKKKSRPLITQQSIQQAVQQQALQQPHIAPPRYLAFQTLGPIHVPSDNMKQVRVS